jgi:hypothetical protein
MSAAPSERQRLQHALAELLVQLGAPRDEMEGLGAGPVSPFRRKRLARQAENPECWLSCGRWAAPPPDG